MHQPSHILFLMAHVGVFRHFDGVIRSLARSGHHVTVLLGPTSESNLTERGLRGAADDTGMVDWGRLAQRTDRWARLVLRARDVRSYVTYLQPGHPSAELAFRLYDLLPRLAQMAARSSLPRRVAGSAQFGALLSLVERVIPPDQAIRDWLKATDPALVVASPYIYARSLETDYVKAARALGIPTAVAVTSWDNLTTKGTFHVQPDVTFVWNERLRREANQLHHLPSRDILVTGAPTFDSWFQMRPSAREDFCRRAQLDPGRPFVVYLCSSKFIASDESAFVRSVVDGLRRNSATADLQVLVRPHPGNSIDWGQTELRGYLVWPDGGDVPDTEAARQDYFDTLFHSVAVIGVNSSALIDAAVVDKPCVTIITDHYRDRQTGIGHFRHLYEGGYLHVCTSFEETASAVAAVLGGDDAKAVRRRAFVRDFVRPLGMDVPASLVMAGALDAMARRRLKNAVEVAAAMHENLSQARSAGADDPGLATASADHVVAGRVRVP